MFHRDGMALIMDEYRRGARLTKTGEWDELYSQRAPLALIRLCIQCGSWEHSVRQCPVMGRAEGGGGGEAKGGDGATDGEGGGDKKGEKGEKGEKGLNDTRMVCWACGASNSHYLDDCPLKTGGGKVRLRSGTRESIGATACPWGGGTHGMRIS